MTEFLIRAPIYCSSQTGCVKAPLAAMSQISRRAHLRPASLTGARSLRVPNGPVSSMRMRSREALWPSPEMTSAKNNGKDYSRSVSRTAVPPAGSCNVSPLRRPLSVKLGISASPVVVTNATAAQRVKDVPATTFESKALGRSF